MVEPIYALMNCAYGGSALIGVGTLEECKAAGERLFTESAGGDLPKESLTWTEAPEHYRGAVLKGSGHCADEWMLIYRLIPGEFAGT